MAPKIVRRAASRISTRGLLLAFEDRLVGDEAAGGERAVAGGAGDEGREVGRAIEAGDGSAVELDGERAGGRARRG